MKNYGFSIGLALAFLLVTAAPFNALAQSDAKAKAREHFGRGLTLVEEGSFQAAAIEFQRAYEISPHYSVLYNLGMAHVMAGRPVEAVDALSQYLSDGKDRIAPDRREQVKKELEEQHSRIALLTVIAKPDGATVVLDGEKVGQIPLSGPIRVGIGEHKVTVSLDGYETSEKKIAVAGRDQVTIEVKLKAITTAVAAPPMVAATAKQFESAGQAPVQPVTQTSEPQARGSETPVEREEEKGKGNAAIVVGVVILGTGVVGLGAAGVMAAMASGIKSDLGGKCIAGVCDDSYENKYNRGKTLTLGANIGFIAGGVLTAAGLVTLIVGVLSGAGPEEKSDLQAAAVILPSRFELQVKGSL